MTSKIEMYLFVLMQTKRKIKNKQTKKQKQKNTPKQNTEYNSHCSDFKKGWGGFFLFFS